MEVPPINEVSRFLVRIPLYHHPFLAYRIWAFCRGIDWAVIPTTTRDWSCNTNGRTFARPAPGLRNVPDKPAVSKFQCRKFNSLFPPPYEYLTAVDQVQDKMGFRKGNDRPTDGSARKLQKGRSSWPHAGRAGHRAVQQRVASSAHVREVFFNARGFWPRTRGIVIGHTAFQKELQRRGARNGHNAGPGGRSNTSRLPTAAQRANTVLRWKFGPRGVGSKGPVFKVWGRGRGNVVHSPLIPPKRRERCFTSPSSRPCSRGHQAGGVHVPDGLAAWRRRVRGPPTPRGPARKSKGTIVGVCSTGRGHRPLHRFHDWSRAATSRKKVGQGGGTFGGHERKRRICRPLLGSAAVKVFEVSDET